MASVQLHKTTDKGLSQGYYGGNKYQNGYEMSYTERERHSQIPCPPTTYGYNQSNSAYEYGQSHGIGHKPYNGGGGHGNGYGSSHMSNGFGQAPAAYGSNHHTSHGSGHHGNGYGGHSSNGVGHHPQGAYGSNHHTNPGKHHGSGYGFSGCDGTNGLGNFTNHGMQHSPPHHGGGHLSGHMMKPQAHGHHGGGHMGHGMTQSSETMYYSNESHYNGGGRGHRTGKVKGLLGKIKTGISGNKSCSDSDSDSDDGGYRRKTVVVSKAL